MFWLIVLLLTQSLSIEGVRLKIRPIYGVINSVFKEGPFPKPKVETPVPSNVVLGTITQKLDNFNPLNQITWEQRFYSNDEFYEPGGPIFIFLGGGRGITPEVLTLTLMADLASYLNGKTFYLEHRYYGASRPTNDTSIENLRFLSVDQVLADVAHFISYITSAAVTPDASSSAVIVIGEHYSASLAVWFRQKYPHLSTGAWASSAPLQSLVNHQQYKELAGAIFRSAGGNECYATIERGFAAMEQYIATGRNNEIQQIFNLCDPIVSTEDEAIFFSAMSEVFALIPQYYDMYSVREVCDVITNGTADSDVHRIARHIDNVAEEYLGGPCIQISYDSFVEIERETSWDVSPNRFRLRSWSYQTCSQLGWYHSSDSRFQPFGNSFKHDHFYESCHDIFGEHFTQTTIDDNINRFNSIYGALDPGVTNTLFIHGELDPWRSIGRQTTLHSSSPAIVIRGAGQGNDLLPITEEDSEELVDAKRNIIETITQWVQNV